MYRTYEDSVQRVVDYLGGNSKDKTYRSILQAVQAAHYELSSAWNWTFLYRRHHQAVKQPYSTGTVGYTHSTRTWTLTGGTWPTWAAYGTLRITTAGQDDDYPVYSRSSGSALIGDPDLNPGEDVTAGATYTLYRDTYTLPEDFLALATVIYPGTSMANFTTYPNNAEMQRLTGSSGTPFSVSIIPDPKTPHRFAMHLFGWPSADDTISLVYKREPRRLRFSGIQDRERQGSVTVSGTTVTGSDTAFDSAMRGCIFRTSSVRGKQPTDETGSNPFYIEDVIREVTSATSLTLMSNTLNHTSATSYSISDPIDFPLNTLNAFQRCCEKQAEITRQRDGGKNDAMALYRDALEDAKIGDRRSMEEFQIPGMGDVERTEIFRDQQMMVEVEDD